MGQNIFIKEDGEDIIIWTNGGGQPAEIFDPLEDDPLWFNVTGGISSLWGQGLRIYHKNTTAEKLLTYGNSQSIDMSVSAILRYSTGSSGGSSFFLVARATGINNFIGVRVYLNTFQVYQRIGAAFSQLDNGTISSTGSIGKLITLIVIGEQVILRVGDTDHLLINTAWLDAGWAGIAQRSWNLGDIEISSNFNRVDLTGTPAIPLGINLQQINPLLIHLDASVLGLNNGDPVNNLGFLSGINPPTYQTPSQNGLGTIKFDGIANYMQGNFTEKLSQMRFFCVLEYGPDIANSGIISIGDLALNDWDTLNAIVLLKQGATGTNWIQTRRGSSGDFISMFSPVNTTIFVLYECEIDLVAGTASTYINGVLSQTDTTNQLAVIDPKVFVLGARILSGITTFGPTNFGEFMLFTGNQPEQDMVDVRNDLMEKWGLSALKQEQITDGNFNHPCGVHWICSTAWLISNNEAVSNGSVGNLSQDLSLDFGFDYELKFTLNGTFTGNGLKVMLGSSDVESLFYANQSISYNIILKAGNSFDKIRFRNTSTHSFIGNMTDVSLIKL